MKYNFYLSGPKRRKFSSRAETCLEFTIKLLPEFRFESYPAYKRFEISWLSLEFVFSITYK